MIARRIFSTFVFLLACTGASWAQTPDTSEYILGTGDVIKVTVYQVPDLSVEARISELGQITFPLLGSVTVG